MRLAIACLLLAAGCGTVPTYQWPDTAADTRRDTRPDTARTDSRAEVSPDAQAPDSGVPDAGPDDSGVTDSGDQDVPTDTAPSAREHCTGRDTTGDGCDGVWCAGSPSNPYTGPDGDRNATDAWCEWHRPTWFYPMVAPGRCIGPTGPRPLPSPYRETTYMHCQACFDNLGGPASCLCYNEHGWTTGPRGVGDCAVP